MSGEGDPQLIAKALRFLAAGFEMAGESGIEGLLERIDGGAEPSPYAAGLPRKIRVTCSDERLSLSRFSARLPFDFLIESIGSGTNERSIGEWPGQAWLRSGQAAQDGSESYDLQRADLKYSEGPGPRFAMEVRMQMGEPDAETFFYAAPADRSGEIYRAVFEVAFDEMFKFLFPVTKAQSEAVIARIFDRFAVRIDAPEFCVTR